MPTFCCPECFGDRGLRKNIIPSLNPDHGTCEFCGTLDVDIIKPEKLADFFEMLIGIYEQDDNGKSLVEWMKDDWRIFSHESMDNAHAKRLLGEILDEKIVQQNFSPSETYKSEGLARWDTLREELMYNNRYFLDVNMDTDRLKELFNYLIADDDIPGIWYRARIQAEDAPYPIDEMGAPPKRLATHGRANPTGIPYLYLGSLPETAIAEIRPHTGEIVCVAKFIIKKPFTAVDLRDPRKLVSPFLLADASAIGQMRADIPLLERLGEELTRPVLPRSAALDYIPSQYLCEFIRKSGYSGVVYRSSVSMGMNLALFDTTLKGDGEVSQYNINRVSVDAKQR